MEDDHWTSTSNSMPPSLFKDGPSPDNLKVCSRLIFRGIPSLRNVSMQDKALHTAVVHYHHQYYPLTNYDPLLNFRAVDGTLPRCSMEISMLIKDVLICWESPCLELKWDNLPEAVTILTEQHFLPEESHEWIEEEINYYSLPKNHLLSFTHILLALHQILRALNCFRG
jgi:hypothetical protein